MRKGGAVFFVWGGIHDDQRMCVGISNPQIAPKAGISAGDDQRAKVQLVSWGNGT